MNLDFSLIMKKSLTIITSIGSTGGFEKAIDIIEKNYENVQKLITGIISLDEVEDFFSSRVGKADDIKVLIDLK